MQEGLGDQHLLVVTSARFRHLFKRRYTYDQSGEKLSEQQDADIVCTEGGEAEMTIVYTMYT